jgi:hypothetical protein
MAIKQETFEDIRKEVVEAGGIACFTMERLRDASPFGRLGPGVNLRISEALGDIGLKTTELSVRANVPVYVYREKSDFGDVMNAISRPTDGGAERIREIVSPEKSEVDTTASATLDEVRLLVVQLSDAIGLSEPPAAAS